ncbi:MAG: DUF1311 domain-containing protein [Ignavibacteriae bacterium]|nr:DUF1311 domain-containing protein [Ignavibacteriota bacterium]MCB9214578.1 DUF1311 domain-containing protein [Ignavibacteria bacterium]
MKIHHNLTLFFLTISVLLGCKASSKVEDQKTTTTTQGREQTTGTLLQTIPTIQSSRSSEELLREADTFALTQKDMNFMESAETVRVEEEMNRMIQQIQTEYAHDTAFINAMADAQGEWLAFRDAHLLSRYPPGTYYGSIEPMCVSIEKRILTRQRIEQLRGWTEGIEEGDVCTGSAKFKPME